MGCSIQNRPWVFMDAGDTFIYGYPTFYQALLECWNGMEPPLTLGEVEKAVSQFIQSDPPLNLVTQDRFCRYFHRLYQGVLELLQFPGDVHQTVEWLWSEWEKGDRLRLFDDSLSALSILKKTGFKMGVISNWDQSFLPVLKRLNVSDFFDCAIGSIDVGLAKPDPAIFEYALNQAGINAEQAWYVGDQIKVDIEPSRALGFQTILVDYYNKCVTERVADYRVPSLSMAVEIICRVETGHSTVDVSLPQPSDA